MERELFCNAHEALKEGDGCCEDGEHSCDWWSEDSEYILCKGACRGEYSCADVGHDSNNGSILLNVGSCNGSSACDFIGYDSEVDITIDIGEYACVGHESCQEVGAANSNTISITVEDDSCTYDRACLNYGMGEVTVHISQAAWNT